MSDRESELKKLLLDETSISFEVSWKDETSSTMEDAYTLCASDDPNFAPCVVALAERQTSGRGQQGRSWISPSGGFYGTFGVPLEIFIDSKQSEQSTRDAIAGLWALPLAVGVSLCRSLQVHTSVALGLKWANDILEFNTLKKVGGILVERKTFGAHEYIFIGIGLNLESNTELPQTSRALETHTSEPLSPFNVVEVISQNLLLDIELFLSYGLQPFHAPWLALTVHRDKVLSVSQTGSVRKGRFLGIGEHGELMLLDETGEVITYTSGSVMQLES